MCCSGDTTCENDPNTRWLINPVWLTQSLHIHQSQYHLPTKDCSIQLRKKGEGNPKPSARKKKKDEVGWCGDSAGKALVAKHNDLS